MLTLITLLILIACYVIIYFWVGICAILCGFLSFIIEHFGVAFFIIFIIIAIILCL